MVIAVAAGGKGGLMAWARLGQVITLWYRPPEILLESDKYGAPGAPLPANLCLTALSLTRRCSACLLPPASSTAERLHGGESLSLRKRAACRMLLLRVVLLRASHAVS